MSETKIEWATTSWNVVTGCTPCAAGCQSCYAKRMATRLAGRFGYPKDEPFRVTLHPDRLDEPLHWKKPRRVFVASMGDLFHKEVPWQFIGRVFDAMEAAPQHTYLLLTKRPEIAAEVLESMGKTDLRVKPFWWFGTSVSTQDDADRNIPHLLRCPATVRFLSVEPLLEEIDLSPWLDQLDWVIVGGES